MKKLLLSVAVVATMGLASCGSDAAPGSDAMCACINAEGEETDECKKLKEESMALYDAASDEEKKEMEKAMEACEK